MCVRFTTSWRRTNKALTVYKIVRKWAEGYTSIYLPHQRRAQKKECRGLLFSQVRKIETQKIWGLRKRYSINRTVRDSRYMGFYTYKTLKDAYLAAAGGTFEGVLLECHIPAGSQIRYGRDIIGRHTINARELTPVRVIL